LKIFKDISLRKYNTFGFDCRANCLISINTEEEVISLLKDHKSFNNRPFILGGGSNLLFTSDFNGTILHPEIAGIKIEERHPGYIIVSSGSGVNWDNLVEWSVRNGYGGLENLSFIPGTVGASPVQNIGAYGIEVKDTIEKVRAVSLKDRSIIEFSNNDCRFGYRNSIFKAELKGKYLITKVYYKLITNPLLKLDYGSLNEEIAKLGKATLRNVREVVINIRRCKLPDHLLIGNAGSFFKNPVIESSFSEILKMKYPDMPSYKEPAGNIKLAAGWLIDQCGWKGKRIGDAGVHDKQALVLVNYGNASGKEILDLSEKIRKSVSEKFGVELEREIEVVGTI
jgi:UDP-N-acetylmuramate dehydrogenase